MYFRRNSVIPYDVAIRDGEKSSTSRFDRMPTCEGRTDRRTDGQTSCIVLAMHNIEPKLDLDAWQRQIILDSLCRVCVFYSLSINDAI